MSDKDIYNIVFCIAIIIFLGIVAVLRDWYKGYKGKRREDCES